MAQETRNPKLDECDKEIAAVLAKYEVTMRPVPFVRPDGGIDAQVVYFDIEKPNAAEVSEVSGGTSAESPLVTPETL